MEPELCCGPACLHTAFTAFSVHNSANQFLPVRVIWSLNLPGWGQRPTRRGKFSGGENLGILMPCVQPQIVCTKSPPPPLPTPPPTPPIPPLTPPLPPPLPPPYFPPLPPPPHDPLEHLQRSPPDLGRLRIVTANCGGLGSEPRTDPRLIAYLACAEPNIAHLQEAGTQFAAAWLAGLPYRVCVGPLFPGGGGLVTLVHARLLSRSQVCKHAQEHSLSVRVEPARGAVLAAVNLHLPPALPAVRRTAVVGDASAFLHGRVQCQDRGRRP